MSIHSRPFAGEDDLPHILALRRAIATHFPHTPPVTEATVRFEYLELVPDHRVDLRLWESEGELVGVGKVIAPVEQVSEPIAYVRPRAHPEADIAAVGGSIVAWAEAVAADWLDGHGQVEITVRRDDSAMATLLHERGYRQDRVFLQLERPLDLPVPALPLPDGYRVRPTAGEAEADDWIALYNTAFRDHYDFRPWTREGKAQWTDQPWYLPELDLVAATPDGSLAALCWTTRRGGVSGPPTWFLELVATARAHRRKGLAAALIAYSIDRVIALGGGTLDLMVDATSETGANRLYERLGFVEVSALVDFRRQLGESNGARPRETTPD